MRITALFNTSRRTGDAYQGWNGKVNFGTYNRILNSSSEKELQPRVSSKDESQKHNNLSEKNKLSMNNTLWFYCFIKTHEKLNSVLFMDANIGEV